MQLTGFHHLTAVTADAAGNHDFYTRILGLRLVKKTVNQDDVSAYHLFYADGKAVFAFNQMDLFKRRLRRENCRQKSCVSRPRSSNTSRPRASLPESRILSARSAPWRPSNSASGSPA